MGRDIPFSWFMGHWSFYFTCKIASNLRTHRVFCFNHLQDDSVILTSFYLLCYHISRSRCLVIRDLLNIDFSVASNTTCSIFKNSSESSLALNTKKTLKDLQ